MTKAGKSRIIEQNKRKSGDKMRKQEIAKNVQRIKCEIENGNPYGEKILLCAATKMQSVEDINFAIQAGVDAVAENKPQEFRDKNEGLLPCPRHFIGHLQTNKIKYLIGKIELYHSCDREDLAQELARVSLAKGIVSNVLIQINIGEEASKGGYDYQNAKEIFTRLSQTAGLRVKGFMAMLPERGTQDYKRGLVRKMRNLFDWAKAQSGDVEYLSMGMSGDYALCVSEGANIIRLGSTLFGKRDYGQQ